MFLYRSFKGAPGEFTEISNQLQSLNMLIADIFDRAQDKHSLLNRNGYTRRQELFAIRDNLVQTMNELADLHRQCRNVSTWTRLQLGTTDLAVMRGNLTVHISALNAFVGSLRRHVFHLVSNAVK